MRLIQPGRLAPVIHHTPYLHVVIDNFLPQHIADQLAAKFPNKDSELWIEYDNFLEKKRALPNLSHLDPLFEDVFNELNGQSAIRYVERLTGTSNLVPDSGLNGGGLHLHVPNQHLGIHLDYTHHLLTGLKRDSNMIIYLSDIEQEWKEEWGGMLEIWDGNCENAGTLVRTIAPIHNRAVIFATTDAVHGVGSITAPPLFNGKEVARKSLALYYYKNDGTAGTGRIGTRFLSRPGEEESLEAMELRLKRQFGKI